MRTALVVVALLVAPLLHAQERTLSWKSLDVKAKLESDGTLRVTERHRMLFDGAWNGGERLFRLEPNQQLELLGMSRIGSKARRIPLTEAQGEGIALGEYRLDGNALRWRARNADDPPFRNATRTYVIEYRLRNVVERKGESYVLDHDFAFPERPGAIEAFSAELELDSAWQAPPDFAARYERANLPVGEGAVLEVQLQHTGATPPQFVAAAAPEPPPAQAVATPQPQPAAPVTPPKPPEATPMELAMFGVFVLAAVGATLLFLRREEEAGRYDPPPHVTPEWIERNLLVHRAEVVGAAWDGATGPGEVAALIAIMTTEGKIQNVPGSPRLRLLVPRESLSLYERGFVDALFINGDEIDPQTLRQYYREVGFNPSNTIAGPLQTAAQTLVGTAPAGAWSLGCVAFLFSAILFPLMAIAFVITTLLGAMYRSLSLGRFVAWLLPMPLTFAAFLHLWINDSPGWLLGNLAAGVVLLLVALRLARWNRAPHELRNLRNFIAAREYFRQWIARGEPNADPRWIPYMLAFGLLPDDRWSVAAVPPPPLVYQQQPVYDQNPMWTRPPQQHTTYVEQHVHNNPVFQQGVAQQFGSGGMGSWASIQSFANAVAARPTRTVRTVTSSGGGWSNKRSSGSGWSWSSGSSSSSSSSSSRSSSSSSSSRSSSSSSSSSRSSGGSGGSRSGGGGGGGW